MQPLVSIVIPSYNHELFIKETIQSIISQSYECLELIVIDDGSTDRSVEIIESLRNCCEKRFKNFIFYSRSNKGVCATLNEAMEQCTGKYVSFIASDDVMLPEKTFTQVNYLENNSEIAGVFGGIFLINNSGDIIGERVSQTTEYTFEDVIKSKHDLPTLTQMYSLTALKEIGGFDQNIKIEDWDLILRLLKNNQRLIYIPEKLAKYRLHDENFSKNKLKMAIEMQKVLEKFKNENLYPYVNYRLNRTILREKFKKHQLVKYFLFKIRNKLNYFISKR